MKGFVFTLDALFALMIAAIGISLVFYFSYSAPTPYMIQHSASTSFLNVLASSNLSRISNLPLVGHMSNQSAASNQNWPMKSANQYNNAGNRYGPSALTLNYVFNANSPIINGTIVAGYGNVYFGAGNVVYALNSTTGSLVWKSSTPYNSILGIAPYVNSTLLYSGMLIYATYANVVALNALNGTVIWGSNPKYGPQSSEPAHTDTKAMIMQSGGMIIGYTFDAANALSSTVYSLYANNGTIAGYSSLYANQITSAAIANGQYLLASASNKVLLQTAIINNTFGAASIWSSSPLCGGVGYPNGILSFLNIIAYGCGTTGNVIGMNSNPIFTATLPSATTGATEYKGHILFQTSGAVSMTSSSSTIWTTSMSAYGSAISNATPVASLQNAYSLWSGNYLVVQNLSTGNILTATQIPYLGTINPYMALAYGRLFVSKGSYLMAFGTCAANPNDSILSALGTLYLNVNGGSCATYLINKLQNSSNLAVTLNGSSVQRAAQFSGQNSYISTSPISNAGQFTLSFWVDPTAYPSNYARILSLDRYISPYSGWTVLGTSSGTTIYAAMFTSSGSEFDTAFANINLNTWQNYVISYNGVSPIIYRNGVGFSGGGTGTYNAATNIPMIIGGGDSNNPSSFLNGQMANVQLYNTSLSSTQAAQLYQEGITGAPISTTNLLGWWPLQGDTNNYAGAFSAGYPTNVAFSSITYNSTSLQNSFSITSQSVPVPVLNYSTGKYKLYNIGVYSWK